jgi:hypothetical protein
VKPLRCIECKDHAVPAGFYTALELWSEGWVLATYDLFWCGTHVTRAEKTVEHLMPVDVLAIVSHAQGIVDRVEAGSEAAR